MNHLFEYELSELEGPTVKVIPSEYFQALKPDEAVTELVILIAALEYNLHEYLAVFDPDDLAVPGNFEKMGEMALQLEVAQKYLEHLKKSMGLRIH